MGAPIRVFPTHQEGKVLEAIINCQTSVKPYIHKRAKIILLNWSGEKVEDLANICSLGKKQVRKILRDWEAHGLESLLRNPCRSASRSPSPTYVEIGKLDYEKILYCFLLEDQKDKRLLFETALDQITAFQIYSSKRLYFITKSVINYIYEMDIESQQYSADVKKILNLSIAPLNHHLEHTCHAREVRKIGNLKRKMVELDNPTLDFLKPLAKHLLGQVEKNPSDKTFLKQLTEPKRLRMQTRFLLFFLDPKTLVGGLRTLSPILNTSIDISQYWRFTEIWAKSTSKDKRESILHTDTNGFLKVDPEAYLWMAKLIFKPSLSRWETVYKNLYKSLF